jgi:hypothetical protein
MTGNTYIGVCRGTLFDCLLNQLDDELWFYLKSASNQY